MAEFKFEIVKHIGVLSENTYCRAKGWCKELNLVSWGTNAPKYDICEWLPEYSKMYFSVKS